VSNPVTTEESIEVFIGNNMPNSTGQVDRVRIFSAARVLLEWLIQASLDRKVDNNSFPIDD